jgi:peptide/nickel transport system ATP-binding protein
MTSGQSGMPVLDVRGLSVDYIGEHGTVHAVTDVSFTLRRGEVLGLAGESGSGKSTLAYAAARLLPESAVISAGEVFFYPGAQQGQSGGASDPINLLSLSTKALRRYRWSDVAVVFQSAMNALNPVMTLGAQIDDVLLTRRPRMRGRERRERAHELLRLVGISPERIKSYPHELSGGMRQRAGIALALALSPQIIIMDEPTTALDVVVQREILGELLRLREQLEFAVIFITHDLSLLLELADRVAIMYAGRLVEQATQPELYQAPRHPYSYGLINAFPKLRGPRHTAVGIPGTPPDLRTLPPGCAFHPRCPLAFDACHSVIPQLRTISPGSDQLVACHLYDPAYRPAPPETSEMAAGYQALVERSRR